MKIIPLKNEVNVRISLPTGKIFEADIREELSIDTKNLREEVLSQPAKYAWWSVLSDLAEQKVKVTTENMLSLGKGEHVQQYITACKQYELLFCTKTAFFLRKEALLHLWSNPNDPGIIEHFKNQLSSLEALASA